MTDYDAYEAALFAEVAAAEVAAENAALAAAEAPTTEDEAFEAWEAARGCY